MIQRRSVLAALVAAPALVPASRLMRLPPPFRPVPFYRAEWLGHGGKVLGAVDFLKLADGSFSRREVAPLPAGVDFMGGGVASIRLSSLGGRRSPVVSYPASGGVGVTAAS